MSYTHYKDIQPMYDDSDEKIALLQERIAEYFEDPTHHRVVTLKDGSKMEVPRYAICKLAFALGFKDRQSLYDIRKRNSQKRVADTLARAMLWIEGEYEEKLQEGNCAGIIFALKNMGWKDSSSVEHTGDGTNPMNIIINNPDAKIENRKDTGDENSGTTVTI